MLLIEVTLLAAQIKISGAPPFSLFYNPNNGEPSQCGYGDTPDPQEDPYWLPDLQSPPHTM
jgi:hypothetical protein